jgi:hypothetical protein
MTEISREIDPHWVEKQRLVPLREASRLSGKSVDTLRKHYRDNIVKISPGRDGMRVGDALAADES